MPVSEPTYVERAAEALYRSFADEEGYAAPVGVVEWHGMAKAALDASGLPAEIDRLEEGIVALLAEQPTTDDEGVTVMVPWRDRLRALLDAS